MRKRVVGMVLLLVFLTPFFSPFFIPTVEGADGDEWLTGWDSRNSHVINLASGTGTDYQVNFTIHREAGANTSYDLYLAGGIEDRFRDLRITDGDGETLLDHWIENMAPDYLNGSATRTAFNIETKTAGFFHNNVTYVTYQGDDIDPYIMAYNHTSELWSDPVKIADNPLTSDSHGIPGLLVDSSGYIHVVYGCHMGALKYSKSTNPENITAWTAMGDIDGFATYPAMIELANGALVVFYRGDTDNRYNSFKYSTNGGTTWTSETKWSDAGASNAFYVGNYAYDSTLNITHVSWFHWIAVSTDYDKVYHAYLNHTDGNVYNASGTSLGVQVNLAEAVASCVVYDQVLDDTELYRGSRNIVRLDGAGDPYILFSDEVVAPGIWYNVYLVNYTATDGWSSPLLVTTTGHGKSDHDFILNSPTDIEVYVVRSMNRTRGGDLVRYDVNGSASVLNEIILTSAEAEYLPINAIDTVRNATSGSELKLLFSQEDNDDYADNDLKMFCWGEGSDPFLGNIPGYADVWVEVADNITASSATIYVYYGNSTVSSVSNGSTTMLGWDDFQTGYAFGDSLKASRGWSGLDGSVTIGGEGIVTFKDTGVNPQAFYDLGANYTGISTHFKYMSDTATLTTFVPYFYEGAVYRWSTNFKGAIAGDPIQYYDGGAYVAYVPGASYDADIWFDFEFRVNDTSAIMLKDGVTHVGGFASAVVNGLDSVHLLRTDTGTHHLDQFFIRKYASPEPTQGAWGAQENAVVEGGVNTAPTRGAYILDQFDAPDLLSDGEPNTRFWFSATDADGYDTIDTLEVAIRVGSTWCNFSYDTTAEGGGSWTKTTEQPYVELFNDGWGGTSTTYYMYAWIQANPGAPDTYGVDVYQRVIDTSSGSSGWGQIYGTPFNIVESGDDSGTNGGYTPTEPDEPPPEGPGDPDWWMDEDNLNDMDRDDLEVLADSLGIDVSDSDTKDDIIAKILDLADDGFTPFEGCGMDEEEKLALLDYLLNMSIPELRLECEDLGISYKLWRDPEPYIILIFTVGYGCTPPDEFYERGYFDPEDWDGDGVANWDDPDMFDAERIGLGARVEDIDISTSIPWIQQNGYLVILLALFLAFMYSQVKKADKPGSRGESLLRPPGKGYVPGERK